MTARVRPAVVEDARRLAEIHVDAWRAAYRGQMPDALLASLSADDRAEKRRQWLEKPLTPDHRTWVVVGDLERIVGFANTGPARDDHGDFDTGELYAIYLDPTKWGRGFGRTLLDHALADLRLRGWHTCVLWVLDTNTRARRFYEIAGFRPDGADKVEPFGGVPLREVRYRLELAPLLD